MLLIKEVDLEKKYMKKQNFRKKLKKFMRKNCWKMIGELLIAN